MLYAGIGSRCYSPRIGGVLDSNQLVTKGIISNQLVCVKVLWCYISRTALSKGLLLLGIASYLSLLCNWSRSLYFSLFERIFRFVLSLKGIDRCSYWISFYSQRFTIIWCRFILATKGYPLAIILYLTIGHLVQPYL